MIVERRDWGTGHVKRESVQPMSKLIEQIDRQDHLESKNGKSINLYAIAVVYPLIDT